MYSNRDIKKLNVPLILRVFQFFQINTYFLALYLVILHTHLARPRGGGVSIFVLI